jgi:hypothetical protein
VSREEYLEDMEVKHQQTFRPTYTLLSGLLTGIQTFDTSRVPLGKRRFHIAQ